MKIELLAPVMIDGTPHKAGATLVVEDALGRNLVYRDKAINAETGPADDAKIAKAAK